jgi:multiple sugar transport system substrate-binding protein
MAQLEFSLLSASEPILAAVREFEAQSGIQVQVNIMTWDSAWAELVRMALFGAGPDLSEVGTTWAESLVAMNALRPFSAHEVSLLGGPTAFLPALWRSAADGQAWAIPWLADTRVLYYRRDWLAEAGIEEATAFATAEQFQQTLHTLNANRPDIAWIIPTARTLSLLHNLAPWVWGQDGHFLSQDGKRTRFNEAAARTGIEAHYRLHPYLIPSAQATAESVTNDLFRQGKAAVTLSGRWTLTEIEMGRVVPEVKANLGIARVPGISFVGGSDLVIWKNSRHAREAIELARYLTGAEIQSGTIRQGPFLPARRDALTDTAFRAHPHYAHFAESLETGRGFLGTYMWGLVEDKLTATLARLWADLFANPNADLTELIANRLQPLAAKLDQTLAERDQAG